MDILGWTRKAAAPVTPITAPGLSAGNVAVGPQTPGVLNQPHEKAFTYPDIPNGNATIPAPTHMNGGSASTQSSSQRNGNKPHAPSSLVTSLQPVAGPPSAVSLASMNALANGSFFGAMGGSQPKEAAPAVKKPVMRIRVATSAGTLLVPTPEDSTVAWLLAEGHARLNRFDKDDEDEREHRQVFTTARSMNGDFIDVSDLVGDVLRDGETLIGLTEIESRYAPKDLHPIFSSIMEKAILDPVYHEMKNRKPRESVEIFFVSGEDDDAPAVPTKIEEEEEDDESDEAKDAVGEIKVNGLPEFKYVPPSRRGSVRRRLSSAQSPSDAALAAAVTAAAAAKKKAAPAPAGAPALTVEDAVVENLLEVLTRVPHPTRESVNALAWVPCAIEVVGEGDDEGFFQIRFLDGGRVEVVGVERLRPVSRKATGGDVLTQGDVEVLVNNEANPDQYFWFPGSVVTYSMGTKASRMSSFTVSVRLQTSARPGTEEDDEAVPLVSVPVYMVRLPGNPAITPRDASFAAAVTSMVDEEDWEEDEVTGETEEFDEVPLAVSEVVEEIVEAAATTVSTDVEVSETAVKADVVEKEAIAEDVVEQTVTDVVGVDSEEQSMTETTTEIVEEKVYVTTIETVEVIETVEETKTEVFEEAAPEAVEVEAKEE